MRFRIFALYPNSVHILIMLALGSAVSGHSKKTWCGDSTSLHPYLQVRGGFAAGPLGLSVEVHVNFDKNLTMLVEKFWNASTGRLNRVNAAIDASNFYFNMLEIFQMYFTFPSFKNIATQRSFNENIHFPLHCLKSTFSFQKSCRKSEKMIFGRSFQLSSQSIFALRNLAISPKNDFGAIFSIAIKVYFFRSEILQ